MKIAIILPSLSVGGAEKNRVKLANMLVRLGCDVEIVVRQDGGALSDMLDPRVSVFDLKARRVRNSLLQLVRYFIRSKPDIVLAAMWPLTVVTTMALKSSFCRARLVVSEHTTLSQSPQTAGVVNRVAARLSIGIAYRLADSVVTVSEGVARDLCWFAFPKLNQSKVSVVYNSCGPLGEGVRTVESRLQPCAGEHRRFRFICVGNLKPAKDYPTLFRAFKIVCEIYPSTLCVVGSGPLLGELESLVNDLGISSDVEFLGYQANPDEAIVRSDVIVLSSRWEGFPNVLVEGLRLGLQVVSTDCLSGPSEILDGGKYGWLSPVGDAETLARNMCDALCNPKPVELLRGRAMHYSDESFLNGYVKAMKLRL